MPLLRPFATSSANLGLQLVGPANCGKSTVVQIAQSVWGSPIGNSGLPSTVSFAQFADNPDLYMWDYFDGFLPLIDLAHFASTDTPKVRARKVIPGLSALATGKGDGLVHEARFSYLLIGNEPLKDMLEGSTSALPLLEIPFIRVASDAPHGIFKKLPHDYDNSLALARSVLSAACEHHGHAAKAFVGYLIERKPTESRTEISRCVELFLRKCGVDRTDGNAVRTAELFGLLYAAGSMAQKAGLLPKTWRIGPAVRHCYEQYLRDIKPLKPPVPLCDRISVLLADECVVQVPAGGLRKSEGNTAKVKQAIGFRKADADYVELWLAPDQAETLLPDWSKTKASDEAKALLVREGDRSMTKRKVFKKGEQSRFYVFRLPRDDCDEPSLLD